MSSLTDDEGEYSSNRASRAALPSFSSVRNDSGTSLKVESSGSGSRKSKSLSPSPFDSDAQDTASYGGWNGDNDLEQANGTHKRRSSQRRSGGFLLEQAFPASRLSHTLLSRSYKSQRDVKGKRKSDGADLFVPKRRVLDARQAHRLSIGSSPLATEVKAPVEMDEPVVNGDFAVADKPQPSETSQSSSRRVDSVEDGWAASSVQSVRPSVGFETDPAQIVSMALSLSEGRRRQASGMRVVSSHTGGGRSASGLSSAKGSNTVHTGSIGQFLTPQRQTSRNVSPRPKTKSPKVNGNKNHANRGFLVDTNDIGEDEQIASISLSEATLKRIQKARNYFELAYEHRRLLSHLPPIRTPGIQSPWAGNAGVSKVYNPLQYVRNRKLRFREKNPIAAEEEGWHDIWQVRTWVDAVISTHHETRHDPDECIRLPDLAHHKPSGIDDADEITELESADGRQAIGSQAIKPKRPRSDWETHPGDFIADAFWLEQGLNKTKIEDKDGNTIYPPNTHFKFSGWRNRAPIHLPEGLQEHTPPPESIPEVPTQKQSLPPVVPDLPTFKSAQHEKKLRKDRGRTIDKIRGSIAVLPKDDSRSRKRLERIMSNVDYSSDSSTAEDSEDVDPRGRKRIARRLHKKKSDPEPSIPNGFGRAADEDAPANRSGEHSQTQSGPNSKRASLDGSRISRLFTKDSSKASNSKQPSHCRSGSMRRDSAKPRVSQDSDRATRSSAEYDTTVPSSPSVPEWPSIAINLSPPQSRSPSPTKWALHSRLNPFRDRSKQREGISTADFALAVPTQGCSAEPDAHEDSSNTGSRDPSPMTRGKSPMTRASKAETFFGEALPATSQERHGSTVSRVSSKSAAPSVEGQNSKIRGIFKGGRIAELVGNEVSRVGDFIWKRDALSAYRPRMSTSTASFHSRHDSDTDDDNWQNDSVFKTPPHHQHKRYASYESVQSDRGSMTGKSPPSSVDKTQYINPNLPVFTSPFQRDKETQEDKKRSYISTTTSPEDDHISRMAAQHRSASRSPRLDRLAPPKLDTSRPPSPPGITINGRQDIYGFGPSLDLTRSRSASKFFNSAVSDKPENFPATSLASLKASRSGFSLSRDWNTSDVSLANSKTDSAGIVTRQDVARAYVLLQSSAIKARQICLRADTPRNPVPKFLLDTIDPSNPALHSAAPMKVARREEHVVAARNLITTLSSQATQFQTRLRTFSATTIPSLHTELQMLEDTVDNSLTPRVRGAADQAGELSMKLTTTSTLAVKALNDSISSAMRRRRRGPFRVLRRVGYKMIEVGVVALLWGIWLVVTLLHGVWRTVAGMWNVGRWLFWLD